MAFVYIENTSVDRLLLVVPLKEGVSLHGPSSVVAHVLQDSGIGRYVGIDESHETQLRIKQRTNIWHQYVCFGGVSLADLLPRARS